MMVRRAILPLLAVFVAAGCDEVTEQPVAPTPQAYIQPVIEQPGGDLDAEWARIAQTELPGFAGFYRSESGEYVVATTRAADAARATGLARSALASINREGRPVRVRVVEYSFDVLKAWKDEMTSLVDGEDVYWLDIDEVENGLTFGVRSQAVRGRILNAAAAAGIPGSAIKVVETAKPEERVLLTDRIRPVQGGLQILHQKGGYTYACTLGFNAVSGSLLGFVTASHCSTTKFGSDGTPQYQGSVISSDRIGMEYSDPASGRDSDAALYRYDSGVAPDWGHIARTVGPAINTPGSLTIDPVYPKFRITSVAPNSVQLVGEIVNKVGRTTGWTQGQITRTCVTLGSLPCQWEALVYSEGGDSGSPMFRQEGSSEPAASRVALWGILWGGPPNVWTTTWYSPISGVLNDLGPLQITCDAAAPTCYPPLYAHISGLHTIKREGYYTWTAQAYHGDGNYTYSWAYRDHGQSTWIPAGTSKTYSRYMTQDSPGFDLRVTVTSAGMTMTPQISVDNLIPPMP